jgi:hypothetical protein
MRVPKSPAACCGDLYSPVQFRDKAIEGALALRATGAHSPGRIAQQLLTRYFEMVAWHLPTLVLGEWCAVFDALTDLCQLDTWSPRYTSVEVQDCAGLGDKWQINQPELVTTLHTMEYAALVAVVDAAQRFWSALKQPGTEGWRPIIERIVGKEHVRED